MKYGLPYKGSKNKLATRIVDLLPRRKHLYDLFCGGCAVTHAAMTMGRFEDYHINDVNWMCPQLFTDVLAGKYDNEKRWISREDFFRLRETDPYVAFVWSFGNNLRDYIYGRKIEPLKKAIHYALFYGDYSLGKELGYDLSFIDGETDIKARYLLIKHFFESLEKTSETGGGYNWNPTREQSASMEPLTDAELRTVEQLPQHIRGGVERQASIRDAEPRMPEPVPLAFKKKCAIAISGADARLQYRERHRSLPQNGGGQLFTSSGDYQDVEVLPDSVIYCDIPYRNTNVYDKTNDFDYERFYDWACRQTEPVFISEYWMPEDRFECVHEFYHRSTYCATKNNEVCERLFVPKSQRELMSRINV